MKIQPKTLKGFRDFLPNEARKRNFVIETLKRVFESCGFEPLETPTLEYEEILAGKYGEEADRLMYKFEDRGERKVALRYDQTVPLARVVAQYANALPFPFKRYQIQNVWRAENTQKGRFREFLQCDIDIVGSISPSADGEVIAIVDACLKALGFGGKYKIMLNDRRNFEGLDPEVIRTIDKLGKIGFDGVEKELVEKKIVKTIEEARDLYSELDSKPVSEWLGYVKSYALANGADKWGIGFSPTLARGLDYYTSTIVEVTIDGYSGGSVGGGGRYDNLIGMFSGQNIPAVGFAFGFDRIIEAMEELGLFPKELSETKALVTIFSKEFFSNSAELAQELRKEGISTDLYPDEDIKLEKQLKYADKKGIKFVIVLGPEEIKNDKVTVKNLETRTQVSVNKNDLLNVLA